MFKPVHGINGVLLAPITSFGTTAYLDADTLALLRKRLSGSDYTYLLIRQAYDYEIVRTNVVDNTFVTLIRGQDDTVPLAFPAGATVEFVLSQAAIEEIITEKALGDIEITGEGIITVDKLGPNTYVVSAPEITLESEDDSILVGGIFPNFVISAPIKSDCCD